MDIALSVLQGVVGAFSVAALGCVLKWRGLVGPDVKLLNTCIYWLFNPAFAFSNVGGIPRSVLAQGLVACVGGCLLSVTLSIALSMCLVAVWPTPLAPSAKITLIMATSFSNVGSLPVYLAAQLHVLPKPDVFGFLVLYNGAQAFLMWGVYYPW